MFAILKHFVPKKVNFPEGMGGSYCICGKSGGEGCYRFLEKMENPGRRGGSLVNFPLWWGYGYFLEPHIGYIVVMLLRELLNFFASPYSLKTYCFVFVDYWL